MNAQTKTELLQAEWEKRRSLRQVSTSQPVSGSPYPEKHSNPVIQHLDALQNDLSKQLDSLNTMVSSMQRLSNVMERMAQRQKKAAEKR